MDYNTWRDYTLNHYGGYISPEAQPARLRRELMQRVTHPRLHEDYESVPAFPERDFGAGPTLFSPEGAKKALQELNTLLYMTQKTRMNCTGIKDAKTQLSPEQYRVYGQNEQALTVLEAWLSPMLRFDEWLLAWDGGTTDQRYQMLKDTLEGRRPDLYKSYERLIRWRMDLQRCVDVLIRQPISQGAGDVRPADVAQNLQHLPLRQAYVRIGTAGHVMQTQPLTPGVTPHEGERRRDQLRDQTRLALCRRVRSVRDETQVTEEPTPTPEPMQLQDEPVAAGTPLLRRSRPLSE
jgi:hypothetical protein